MIHIYLHPGHLHHTSPLQWFFCNVGMQVGRMMFPESRWLGFAGGLAILDKVWCQDGESLRSLSMLIEEIIRRLSTLWRSWNSVRLISAHRNFPFVLLQVLTPNQEFFIRLQRPLPWFGE